VGNEARGKREFGKKGGGVERVGMRFRAVPFSDSPHSAEKMGENRCPVKSAEKENEG